MTIENILAFNLALLLAIASPGPALLIAVRTSVSAGRAAGIAMGYGLGLMAATWTMMALLGLDTAFRLFPLLYTIAKVLGGGCLLYIAYLTWRRSSEPIGAEARPARHAFRQGFLINLFNPKSVLFAAAVLIAVFPPGLSATENLLIVLNHLAVEIIFYALLAFGMSKSAVSHRYLKTKIYMDRTAAAVLGVLAVRLLASR